MRTVADCREELLRLKAHVEAALLICTEIDMRPNELPPEPWQRDGQYDFRIGPFAVKRVYDRYLIDPEEKMPVLWRTVE